MYRQAVIDFAGTRAGHVQHSVDDEDVIPDNFGTIARIAGTINTKKQSA